MQRFEYNIVSLTQVLNDVFDPVEQNKMRQEAIDWMNGFGSTGWDVVHWNGTSYGIVMVIKREID